MPRPTAILYITPSRGTSNVPSVRSHRERRHGVSIQHLLDSLESSSTRARRQQSNTQSRTQHTTQQQQDNANPRSGQARTRNSTPTIHVQAARKRFSPQVDARVLGDKLIVECDVPGVSRSELAVKLHKTFLSIEGKRRAHPSGPQNASIEQPIWANQERRWGKFTRHIKLPEGAAPTPNEISARLSGGVLRVELDLHRRRGTENATQQTQVQQSQGNLVALH